MLLRCSTLLAAVGLFAAAWAQESGTAEFEPVYAGQESDIIKIDVARVPLLFTVTDRRNRFITDLGREDFRVFDDGWEQEIREFDRESDLPLRIGVILDTSNSIRARFKFEQEAAIEFLQGVLAEEHDRAFLVSFDTRAELIVDYTNNIDDLADGVRRRGGGGGAPRGPAGWGGVV
ncbi:MAG: VWA domain-containing protein [Acidobacteriia bacterium]|nr:VWA domain-containing protein [Terriglobia bacterium]